MPDNFLSWCIAIGFGVVFIIIPIAGVYYGVKNVLGKDNVQERRD